MSYRLFWIPCLHEEDEKQSIAIDIKEIEAFVPVIFQDNTYTKVYLKSNAEWLIDYNFYHFYDQIMKRE